MSVIATGSKYTQKTFYMYIVGSMAFGLYYFYDAWFDTAYRAEQLKLGDGVATPNLNFGRYIIIPLAILSIYWFINIKKSQKLKIEATDAGLQVDANTFVSYDDFVHIEDRFKTKGFIVVAYMDNGIQKEVKLSDRKYDGLGLLKDELVNQTNAQSGEEDTGKSESSAASV